MDILTNIVSFKFYKTSLKKKKNYINNLSKILLFFTSCVKRLVKSGMKYLMSNLAKPLILDWIKLTSISSSVNSDKCSESIACP